MLATVARRDCLDEAITAMAAHSVFTPVMIRLGCLRGVSTLTAFGLAVEIGDWTRLDGRSIGSRDRRQRANRRSVAGAQPQVTSDRLQTPGKTWVEIYFEITTSDAIRDSGLDRAKDLIAATSRFIDGTH
ncbi:hypothetical protein ACTXG6_43135 [Pseudonocardia sp. Cha107L01]|uniref:hypothetical protein n=1 Tax=Pseudonocardia sp. Cha107L01 TaxID=3457576 RepID=UPI00403E6984